MNYVRCYHEKKNLISFLRGGQSHPQKNISSMLNELIQIDINNTRNLFCDFTYFKHLNAIVWNNFLDF